jgi:hypothetical protein
MRRAADTDAETRVRPEKPLSNGVPGNAGKRSIGSLSHVRSAEGRQRHPVSGPFPMRRGPAVMLTTG